MSSILIDSEVAKAIARALRTQVPETPALDAFHQALADILLSAPDEEEAATDAAVRKSTSSQVDASAGVRHPIISIRVRNGVVELRGTTSSEHHRQTMRAIAESTPGVREVHDHLIWIDPETGAYMLSTEDSYSGLG
jgi:osmotically-inducible protein OsmY